MKKRIYISGSITKDPDYMEHFNKAEEFLISKGYFVVNPAKNHCDSYKDYMDLGLFQLMHCDEIYMLKGFEESEGATLELHYAIVTGLKTNYEGGAFDG